MAWDRRRRGRARGRDRRRRPRRRLRARVHVGHHERPEGRDAQAPHAARRGRAHRGVDHAGRAEPHGLAGHPRDRHARRGARADGAGRGHPPHRPVGSGARARRSCSRPDIGAGTGAAVFLASLLDHPDFTPEHAAQIRRVGLGGAPVPPALGERAAAHGIVIMRAYGSTEHPSVTGCSFDDPADEAPRHRRPADDRRRDPAARRRRRAGRGGHRGRDLVARPRSVPRLHRSRADRARVRRRRLVPHRRHGRARRRRLPHDHRPASTT